MLGAQALIEFKSKFLNDLILPVTVTGNAMSFLDFCELRDTLIFNMICEHFDIFGAIIREVGCLSIKILTNRGVS